MDVAGARSMVPRRSSRRGGGGRFPDPERLADGEQIRHFFFFPLPRRHHLPRPTNGNLLLRRHKQGSPKILPPMTVPRIARVEMTRDRETSDRPGTTLRADCLHHPEKGVLPVGSRPSDPVQSPRAQAGVEKVPSRDPLAQRAQRDLNGDIRPGSPPLPRLRG